jgi:hypothetical protein
MVALPLLMATALAAAGRVLPRLVIDAVSLLTCLVVLAGSVALLMATSSRRVINSLGAYCALLGIGLIYGRTGSWASPKCSGPWLVTTPTGWCSWPWRWSSPGSWSRAPRCRFTSGWPTRTPSRPRRCAHRGDRCGDVPGPPLLWTASVPCLRPHLRLRRGALPACSSVLYRPCWHCSSPLSLCTATGCRGRGAESCPW